MPADIKIPALGESVAGGQIAKWHFNEGDFVKVGDILLTLETDKVAAEVTAEASGALHIGKQPGDDVEVGAVVGQIDEAAAAPAAKAPEQPKPAPAAVPEPKPSNITESKVVPKPAPAPEPAAKAPVAPEGRVTRKKMSPLRKKIADQLVSAQRTAAILTTFNECDMSNVMALRSKLQDAFVAKNGVKLGFMSFFIKAVVEALKAVPQINVRVEGEEIVQQHYYDIGVAVGTERGLIVPVLRDADQMSIADIEKKIAEFGQKAKDGKLTIEDLTGGTFSISNGGVFGSMLSTPIINPPQSAILGVHATKERPVVENGQIVIRPMNYLAMSYDHRIIDGREAVLSLVAMKEALEDPARLLLDI
jgi:2-oxoglutarate dehydrogenase E2 component (dihydrolipoamide succinyltransferase)